MDRRIVERWRPLRNVSVVTMRTLSSSSMCILEGGHYVSVFISVYFVKILNVFWGRFVVIYVSKRRLASSMNLQVLEAVDVKDLLLAPKRSVASSMHSFRPYGEVSHHRSRYYMYSVCKGTNLCHSSARLHT